MADGKTVRVVDSALDCPPLPFVVGGGNARAVLWPGRGALYRTIQIIELHGGDRTIEFSHPNDSVYYVKAGEGSVIDVKEGVSLPLVEGSMIHTDAGDTYRFEADGADGLTLIGGPCPADERLYASLENDKGN